MADRKKVPAIAPPRDVGPADPGYLRQCGFALEPSIHRLIEMAVGAGWTCDSVLAAIVLETERQARQSRLGARLGGDDGDDGEPRGTAPPMPGRVH